MENSREKPYDFSLIKETIGQAMTAKKEVEAKEAKRLENEKLKNQQQEEEKQKSALRKKALDDIKKINGVKEEFITESSIEAKENDIIGKQLNIEKNK
jgi:hypothetical protein